jgi:hypothetical protein
MTAYPHSFETRVARHDVGTYRYTVVFLPAALAASLGVQGRVRFSGEINDVPLSGAWQPVRGRWFAMLSKTLLRDADARLGSTVTIRFRLEEADAVEIPEPLRIVLSSNSAARAAWRGLRPGQQRGLAHRIASAKQAETVSRRVAEVTRLLLAGGPFGPPSRTRVSSKRPSEGSMSR